MELGVCLLIVSFLGNECCVQNISEKKKTAMPTAAAHHAPPPSICQGAGGPEQTGQACVYVCAHTLGVQVRSVFRSL